MDGIPKPHFDVLKNIVSLRGAMQPFMAMISRAEGLTAALGKIPLDGNEGLASCGRSLHLIKIHISHGQVEKAWKELRKFESLFRNAISEETPDAASEKDAETETSEAFAPFEDDVPTWILGAQCPSCGKVIEPKNVISIGFYCNFKEPMEYGSGGDRRGNLRVEILCECAFCGTLEFPEKCRDIADACERIKGTKAVRSKGRHRAI